MDKSPDAFRTISEVAADLALPQHVLRFWETKFPQIRPLKRGGGRRYYRPDDVDLLKGIRHLLYGEGYTIRGVQRLLKAQGVRFVMSVWRDGAPQPGRGASPVGAHDGNGAHHPGDDDFAEADFAEEEEGYDEAGLDADGQPASAAAMAQRFAPQGAPDELDRVVGRPRDMVEAPVARAVGFAGGETVAQSVRVARAPGAVEAEPRSTFGHLIDRFRGQPRGEGDPNQAPPLNSSLSRDEIRRLQATLFELLECKRLLDQVR